MSTAATEGKAIGKAGLAEVAAMDELKQLGWRTEKLASGYSAYEIAGDRKIGPVSSIKALHTQVMLASGPPQEKPLGNGKAAESAAEPPVAEPRLPTMEEPEIDELNLQGDNCIFAKEKRDQAKTEFDDACDVMRQKMHEFGRKRYNRRGFSLVIEDTEKLVIKKAEQAPPKNPKAKQPALKMGN